MSSAEISLIHQHAVDNFVRLNLSYRFTVSLLKELPATAGPCRLRFLFSKPSDSKPEPEIMVGMDLEVVGHKGTQWTYALFFEGQKYKRVITIDEGNVTGKEFNERLIDKIYLQKEVVRQRRLWEP